MLRTKGSFSVNVAPPTTMVFKVTASDATAVAKKLGTINVPTGKAVAYQVVVVNRVVSDAATSHALAVGVVGATYNDIIAAANLKSAVGTNTVAGSNPVRIATSNTDLFALPTIVGSPTVGEAWVYVETAEFNLPV